MPRYFFHTQLAGDVVRDDEGIELRDPDQAWQVARATIREILADDGQAPQLMSASLQVTDISGDIVLEFPFSEALLDDDAFGSTTPRKH